VDLTRFPRRRYTPYATPIEKLERLTRHLGGPDIYIKRDDLTGLAAGGNKTRKLEFLVADALARGADTLITAGAVQSNHCRLTAAAAAKEGLKCRLVLEQRVPKSYDPNASGNNFLFDLLAVESITVVDKGADIDGAMQSIANELAREGRRAYVIPVGGSNAIGELGYVACAQELLWQCFDLGLRLDHIVCASGSGGTHSGLLVGLQGNHANIPVTGINVSRPRAEQEHLVHSLTAAASGLLQSAPVPRESVRALDEWVGPGYSLPTDAMIEAVRLLARLESVLLDPVYTGKAMAGLIGLASRGEFTRGQNVLYMHTGGSPALYAYRHVLASRAVT
jgi:D-cysteine desulfhydrase